jgi:hypothetical protein
MAACSPRIIFVPLSAILTASDTWTLKLGCFKLSKGKVIRITPITEFV